MAPFDAVFFDLKGTLWDHLACTEHVTGVVFPKLTDHLPTDTTEEELRRQFNVALLQSARDTGLVADNRFSLRDRFDYLLKQYGIDEPRLARELSSQYNSARRFAMRGTVQTGARSVLDRLRSNDIPVGIITNGGPAIQRQTLRCLALHNHLDFVVSGDIEGYSKPDPRLFNRAIDLVDANPEDVLYVGDSLFTDILGAHRAGLPAAWLHRNHQHVPENLPEPDYFIEQLSDVLKIVD